MSVFSSDGTEVGQVIRGDDEGFIIERGIFFTDDFYCRYDEVADIDDGAVTLLLTIDQLGDLSEHFPAPRRWGAAAAHHPAAHG